MLHFLGFQIRFNVESIYFSYLHGKGNFSYLLLKNKCLRNANFSVVQKFKGVRLKIKRLFPKRVCLNRISKRYFDKAVFNSILNLITQFQCNG